MVENLQRLRGRGCVGSPHRRQAILARRAQRALLAGLVERIDIGANQIDIHLRATRFGALFDGPAAPLADEANDETQILSVPVRLRQSGREIRMLIGRADPFSTAKPDARLIKLLIRAHRFNATLAGSGGTPFAALAKQEGVSPSYFTRLIRLSYLAPDITQAILDGRQPSHLTAVSCWHTHACRWLGTIKGTCSALFEPIPL
jgi:site-specific DNA recombinase